MSAFVIDTAQMDRVLLGLFSRSQFGQNVPEFCGAGLSHRELVATAFPRELNVCPASSHCPPPGRVLPRLLLLSKQQ
jgi:hypothetical protein